MTLVGRIQRYYELHGIGLWNMALHLYLSLAY